MFYHNDTIFEEKQKQKMQKTRGTHCDDQKVIKQSKPIWRQKNE